MKNVRLRIEGWFERLGLWVVDHRWVTLFAVTGLAVLMIAPLPRITVDNRTESFFLEGDPAIEDYNAFREQFGMDEFVVVAINPPGVFNLEFLDQLLPVRRKLNQFRMFQRHSTGRTETFHILIDFLNLLGEAHGLQARNRGSLHLCAIVRALIRQCLGRKRSQHFSLRRQIGFVFPPPQE